MSRLNSVEEEEEEEEEDIDFSAKMLHSIAALGKISQYTIKKSFRVNY